MMYSTLIRLTCLCLLVATLTNAATLWENAMFRFQHLLQDPEAFTYDVPTNQLRAEYDFIVIGAGSGGSVVTNRLTEVPKWNVLLMEAGGDEMTLSEVPAMAPMLVHTYYNWGYHAIRQDNVCLGFINNTCLWPRGKGMGGTSILNYMVYTRGHPKDYDGWVEMGNPGWDWHTVLHYFLKSENAAYDDLEFSPYHSTGGYLDVQKVPYESQASKAFFQSALDNDYPIIDYNSGEMMGFSRVQATLRNGTRCSANKAFLRPIRSRPNLHVAKFAHVTKILINPEDKKAYGVEFIRDGKRWFVKAKKEVILSAGALNSPQLLMLSGIGPRKHLENLKIPVVQDLPGVGVNLQDHLTLALPFLVNTSGITVNAHKIMTSMQPAMDYIRHGKGPYTLPGGAEALGFIRTPIAKTPEGYPDIELVFAPGHVGSGEPELARKLLGMKEETFNVFYKPINQKDGYSLCPIIMQPNSKGWIRLKDKNPLSWPLMYANYYDDDHDLDTMVEGVKAAVKLSQSQAFKKYGSTVRDVKVPGCEKLEFATDEYWKCMVQQLTVSLGHQCCTAKMGPDTDSMAVVDPELRVYGIQGLRVVDASVMPKIPSAHTNAPVFMIGEKAADLIKKTYGK